MNLRQRSVRAIPRDDRVIPVCPACRTPIRLDAHICVRCGLAVRPTCSNCAEPLMHGMTSCWFCHETIDEPHEVLVVPPVAPQHTAPAASVAAPPVHVTRPHASVPVFRAGRRRSAGGALFLWLVFAAFLTLVLIAIEMSMPRFPSVPPAALELESRAFRKLGFAIRYPADWTVRTKDDRVSVTAPEPLGKGATRGLRVTRSELDFAKVDDQARTLNRARVDGYRTLGRDRERVDGRDTFVFVFAGDDLRFEQWWVDRGKRSLRLEFWSRLADEGAPEVNERIARTLSLL